MLEGCAEAAFYHAGGTRRQPVDQSLARWPRGGRRNRSSAIPAINRYQPETYPPIV